MKAFKGFAYVFLFVLMCSATSVALMPANNEIRLTNVVFRYRTNYDLRRITGANIFLPKIKDALSEGALQNFEERDIKLRSQPVDTWPDYMWDDNRMPVIELQNESKAKVLMKEHPACIRRQCNRLPQPTLREYVLQKNHNDEWKIISISPSER